MESKPAVPESVPPAVKRTRFSKLQIAASISGILLFALVVVTVVTSSSGSKVVWLTPTQLAARTQPGPFSGFKQKVRNLAAPILKRFRRTQSLITLDCKVLTLSSAAVERSGLGPAFTTNAQGMHAWILTGPETAALQQFVKTNTGANVLGSSAISTMHGGQARMVVGNTLTAGTAAVHTTIDVLPRSTAGSIRLVINATTTSKENSATNAVLIQTNLAAACQALVSSGGCLVVRGSPPNDESAKSYWMIISPRAWTTTGKK